jgi:hypothetical protein
MKLSQSRSTDLVPPRGFMVLHGNRLEDLRDLLVQYLQAHPLPPLQPEVILLQSNGMKHWLELALADDAALGICAATRMVLPSSYLWQMYRTVLGADAVPTRMPFDKVALLWRLVRVLPTLCQSRPVYAPLQRYLSGDNAARKLYQWHCRSPTCWTLIRVTAPTGCPTGRTGTTSCADRWVRRCHWHLSTSGRHSCGATFVPMWGRTWPTPRAPAFTHASWQLWTL